MKQVEKFASKGVRKRIGPLRAGSRELFLELDRTDFPGGVRHFEVELEVPAEAEDEARRVLHDLDGRVGGRDVSGSGDTVVSGAPFFPGPAGETGAAFVHRLVNPLPTSYCTAGTSASGCRATLSASGTPSSTATSGFVLSAIWGGALTA